jgi:HemY protein
MIAILWFLFIAFAITASMVWVLDHNGVVLINWLGYEAKTDILTAIILAIFFTLVIFAFSYLAARILAIRFPNLLKFFFRKTYLRKLEKLVKRHHQAFDLMTQTMLALEVNDKKAAQDLQKKFEKLIKNPSLNNFFLGKIHFEKEEFAKAAEYFSKNTNNKHAQILVLKSKFNLALQNKEENVAIAYAKQILALKRDSLSTVKILFSLYKKQGMWQEAKALISEYGSDNFKDELQKRDVAVINTAIALEAYQQKKFSQAIKFAKIALKAENNFLPAIEIQLKSWIKRGFVFKANWKIKSLWRENPHLIFAEIFDLTNRKASAKNRIKAMKKLADLNAYSSLGKVAIGLVAYRAGEYETAKDYMNQAIAQEKTHRAYKILAYANKALGNEKEFEKNLTKANMLERDDHYTCNSCSHLSSRWSAKCSSCGSYDSLEFNI